MKEITVSPSAYSIDLGRCGENEARAIVFDLTVWAHEQGEGIPELVVQRPDESMYVGNLISDGENRYKWILMLEDTGISGQGKAQLNYIVGGKIAKSQTFDTYIAESLSGEVTPEGEPSWAEKVIKAGASAEAAAKRAEDAADRVEAGGGGSGGGTVGTTDYGKLKNKPQINGNELVGNKTAKELGLVTKEDIPTVPTKVSELQNDSNYQNGEQVKKLIEQNSGTGEGLTQAQITALDEMFKVCAYKETPTTQYEAFKKAFGIESVTPTPPVEKTYTITNTLSNVENSNGATSIKEKTTYSGKLTADEGYTLEGATVTITMGETDITSTSYSNGNINIASATGNIIITATAVKVEAPPEPSAKDYVNDPANIIIANDNTQETKQWGVTVKSDVWEKLGPKIYVAIVTDWVYGNEIRIAHNVKEDYVWNPLSKEDLAVVNPIDYNHIRDKRYIVWEIDKTRLSNVVNAAIKERVLNGISFSPISNQKHTAIRILKEYKE